MSSNMKEIVLMDLDKTSIITLLQNTINQLEIVENISIVNTSEENEENDKIELKEPISIRLEKFKNTNFDLPFSANKISLEEDKLHKTKKFLKSVLIQIVIDFHTMGSSPTLYSIVNDLNQRVFEEQEIINESNTNFEKVYKLQNAIKIEKQEFEQRLEYLNKEISLIMDKRWDDETENQIKNDFLEKWDKARRYQMNLREFLKLSQLSDECEKLDETRNNESYIHTNIIKFYNVDINNMIVKIEATKTKYAEDCKKIENKIKQLEEALEKTVNKKEIKLAKYQRQNKLMNDWLEQKAKMKRQEELKIQRENAAIKIQSWWRGTMVRRCLGPYKTTFKKGKKSKK